MRLTARRFFSASAAALAIALVGLATSVAQAASISYGNFGPVAPGVSFWNVTESSGTDAVPLYGPPTPFATGLDFDPTSFVASATGGAADITDGQMNFTVQGQIVNNNAVAIKSIGLNEGGDYTLVGGGTAASQVIAGAILGVKVVEIDGVAVAPINLSPVNGSVAYNLAANSGIVQPWSLGLMVNVESQLTSLGVPFIVGATKAEVVLNNSLVAISEPGSVAFIAKKDFVISIVPEGGIVPEPSTLGLMGLALCGLGATARRKS
jgi:hypothetical protein